MIDALINDGHLEESNRCNMRKTLLLPHLHQYQRQFHNELDVGKAKESSCCKSESKDLYTEPGSEFKSNIENGKLNFKNYFVQD